MAVVRLRRDWQSAVFRRSIMVDGERRMMEFSRGELATVDDGVLSQLRRDIGAALEQMEELPAETAPDAAPAETSGGEIADAETVSPRRNRSRPPRAE